MREKFFKNDISENISQKLHDQWKITLIYFQVKGTGWKIDLDDFITEFDSRNDNRRINWGDDDIKFGRRLCRHLCENHTVHCVHCLFVWIFLELVRFAYEKTVNQRRVEKSAFEDQP